MSDKHESGYELVGGMLAAESPQQFGARIIELLERGEIERARELMNRSAARTAALIAHELDLIEKR